MRNFLITILLLTLLACCTNKLRLDKQQSKLSDTSKSKYYQALQQSIITVSNSLTLTDIHNGTDSFEFRLWTPTKGKHYAIVSIQYYNDTWLMAETYFKNYSAKRIKINFENPNFDDLLKDTTNDWTLEIPITDDSVIAKIVDTLKQFDIGKIPMQNQISGFNINGVKGYRYIIEYATKENYKLIEYISPNIFYQRDIYNQKVADLLKFLQRYATDIVF